MSLFAAMLEPFRTCSRETLANFVCARWSPEATVRREGNGSCGLDAARSPSKRKRWAYKRKRDWRHQPGGSRQIEWRCSNCRKDTLGLDVHMWSDRPFCSLKCRVAVMPASGSC